MSSTNSPSCTSVFSAAHHCAQAMLAMLLRRSKTCRVIRRSTAAGPMYIRWRPWYLELLVPAGSACMALVGEQVRFLPRRQWLKWETRVYASLYNVHAEADSRGRLLLPSFPGIVLADLLRLSSYTCEQKLEAFRAAVDSLRQAHQTPILWPDGIVRAFSHGDATARNVLCGPPPARTIWIDFETLHAPSLPAETRHADDLRALIWSAAECLGPQHFDALCLAATSSYTDDAVLAHLDQMLARHPRPNLYHLAQGMLPPAQHDLLIARLRLTQQLTSEGAQSGSPNY